MTKQQWIVLGIFGAGALYGILSAIFPQIAVFVDPTLQALLCCGVEGVVGAVGIFMKGANKTEEELAESQAKLTQLSDKRLDKLALAQAKSELKQSEAQQLADLQAKHKALLLEEQKQVKTETIILAN